MTPDKPSASEARELLSCPFCGKPGAISCLEDEPGDPISFWVNCSCGVETHETRTEAEAIAKWNTRASPAPQGGERSRLDGLEDQANELRNSFGRGSYADGLVRDRLAEVEAEIATLKSSDGPGVGGISLIEAAIGRMGASKTALGYDEMDMKSLARFVFANWKHVSKKIDGLEAENARLRSELEQARASLKECAGILETLVDPAKQHISSVHIYAQSFEAIVRSRSILAVASPERQP